MGQWWTRLENQLFSFAEAIALGMESLLFEMNFVNMKFKIFNEIPAENDLPRKIAHPHGDL